MNLIASGGDRPATTKNVAPQARACVSPALRWTSLGWSTRRRIPVLLRIPLRPAGKTLAQAVFLTIALL
ncbi:MAG TPA: hypothetical protein VFB88_01085, partial [Xanthobacteraceae bacterium]|nr:hypothetical protein [Xanthobacteraceae bacterium]